MTKRIMNKRPIRGSKILKHTFLIIASLLSAFPFYWLIVSATNTTVDILTGRIIPGTHLFANLKSALDTGYFGISFWNSLRNSTITTIIALLISSMAGYGFVIYKDKFKSFFLSVILLSMMVPVAATLIPLFRFFSMLGITNTLIGFMLPLLSTALLIFMFRQATQGFPLELVQAARIDGMKESQIFLFVFVPIMKPTYAAAATITFMNTWNNYLWPLVILQRPEQRIMPIFAALMLDTYTIDYGMVMVTVTIMTLPTLIVFFLLQKSFVEGILGSLKQ
jgi:lactose/L-arabinose transport system permease protein